MKISYWGYETLISVYFLIFLVVMFERIYSENVGVMGVNWANTPEAETFL